MSSDDSDDEPLAVLAAAKQLGTKKFVTKHGLEIDVDYDPKARPKKKKAKKPKTMLINKEALSIHFESKLKKVPVIQRPDDVWLYMKDFNPSGPYSCLLCPEWFISKTKIVIHYILNHKKDYCGVCRYFITDREAYEPHLKFHTPWPCSQCDQDFQTELESRLHLTAAHSLVHCRFCHFRLPDGDQYHLHLLEKHNVKNISQKDSELLWEIESDESQFLCVLCLKAKNPFSAFFNHFMGFHHFTIKCIASIVGGKDTPFSLYGADLSPQFVESLKDQGKCGYVDLDRNNADLKFNIKKPGEFELLITEVKEEALSDTEDIKKEIVIRDDFDEIKAYKGDEDFDVTQMELIVLEKNYFDYLNEIITTIDSDSIPTNSSIHYEKDKPYINADIDCELCNTKHHTVETFAAHISKMHNVKIVPIYSCRLCVTTFDNQNELSHHCAEELKDFEDLWLCQFCDKEFDSRVSTRNHMMEHKSDLDFDNCFSPHLGFKCRYCPALFWNETDREQHHIQVHFQKNKENFYKCECDQIYSDKIWFTYHYFKHHHAQSPTTNLLFKCCLCAEVLPCVKQMKSHFESQHPKAKKIFCSLEGCQYKPFSHKKSFQLHLRAMHRSTVRRDLACSCSVCGREFPNARACSAHAAQSHGPGKFKCRICKLLLHSMDERKLHYLLVHPGKNPFMCNVCGKSFLYKSSLYVHRKEHSADKQDYTCEICQKVFTKKDSFREHLMIHEGPRHACSYCPMRFVQRSNMLRHERRHTGERPYQCPHCERTFADKGACNSHSRTHSKHTSFECLYCGQTFAQKSKLTYHIRRHTGENLETCSVCSKLFTSACALKEHMKTHIAKKSEPVKCPLCARSYTDERYMLRHLRGVHTASRHPCPLCSKQLSSAVGLKQHVLTHSTRNMFWCKFCPKSYNVKRTMVRHLRHRHGLKGSEINVKDFYRRLEPRDCDLKLDEATMKSIFGQPKRNANDILISDFVTFPDKLNLPKNSREESEKKTDEEDDDEEEDNDDDSGEQTAANEAGETNDSEQQLEPTDFVSIKIEPMDIDDVMSE